MALKYILESLDALADPFKAEYKEKQVEINGTMQKRYVLDCDEVVEKSKFIEFRNNNIALQADVKKLTDQYTGIADADKARQLLKICGDMEISEAEKVLKKGGIDGIVEGRTKAMRDEYEGKLAEATRQSKLAQDRLESSLIESEVLKSLGKLQVQPGGEAFVLQQAKGFWKLVNGEVVSVDTNGQPRYGKDGTTKLSVAEWVGDLPKAYSWLFKESSGSGAAGSGSGGTGSGDNTNPWKKESFNLTKQAQLTKNDPEKANRLRQAAGQ